MLDIGIYQLYRIVDVVGTKTYSRYSNDTTIIQQRYDNHTTIQCHRLVAPSSAQLWLYGFYLFVIDRPTKAEFDLPTKATSGHS